MGGNVKQPTRQEIFDYYKVVDAARDGILEFGFQARSEVGSLPVRIMVGHYMPKKDEPDVETLHVEVDGQPLSLDETTEFEDLFTKVQTGEDTYIMTMSDVFKDAAQAALQAAGYEEPKMKPGLLDRYNPAKLRERFEENRTRKIAIIASVGTVAVVGARFIHKQFLGRK